MNLLPVPRHVDLLERTVPAREPHVHVGASGLADEGYEITIGQDGEVSVDAADAAGAFCTRARHSPSSLTSMTVSCPSAGSATGPTSRSAR